MVSTAVHAVPAGALCVRSKQSVSVAYLYTTTEGRLAAVGYAGRAANASFRYRFPDAERRAEWVAAWFRGQDAKEAAKRARKAVPRSLQVGDVLASSWGYDQTNVDFYQVVRLVGEKSVALREIKGEKHEDGDMTGYIVPLPDHFTGDELTKLVDPQGGVRITSYSYAGKAERIVGAQGEQLGYRPYRWSAYA